jgi:hypothetical protein
MKITAISVMTVASLLIGATAALAQGTTGGGAAANGTTPGAIGSSNVPNQSLQSPKGGQGLGYSPTDATTYSPNGATSPMPGPSSTTGTGSSASGVSDSSGSSSGR